MKKNNKKIFTLDKFIDFALYDKDNGYYVKKNPFGKKGDFITSPNISILFTEMIAIWIISLWEFLGRPKEFNVVELGAGNGEMAKDLIKTFERFPNFKNSYKLNIFEKSKSLIELQKKKLKLYKVKWIKNLEDVSDIPSIFIANEFFDALPIKQFLKTNDIWYEKKIECRDNGLKPKFFEERVNVSKIKKKLGLDIFLNQNFVEFSPSLFEYLKIISKKITLNDGGILIIDYGNWEKKMRDTLKSFSKHKPNNLFENIGKSDITYDINFQSLKKILNSFDLKINGSSTQKSFLLNMGILERAEIISKNLTFSKKADIYYRLKKLIDKKEMGEIFKVLFASNSKNKFNIGF